MDTRNPTEIELNSLVEKISNAFHYGPGEGSVAKDFPRFYTEANRKNLWVNVNDAGEIVAHAGLYIYSLMVEGNPLLVAGIGGVFTEDEHQGQGLATALVDHCARKAQEKGCALVFLWTDKASFYEKMGFQLVGRQWTMRLNRAMKEPMEKMAAQQGLLGDGLELRKNDSSEEFLKQSYTMLQALPIGVSRETKEHKDYIDCKSCANYSLWSGNQMLAYFLLGKGKDLQGYVHEWAGSSRALLLLSARVSQEFQEFKILSPQWMPEECPFIYQLESLQASMSAEYMGLAKLLDFRSIEKLVGQYFSSYGVTADDWELKKVSAQEIQFRWKKEISLFTERELLNFLFGAELPGNSELRAFFPMRLWFWGMDSV